MSNGALLRRAAEDGFDAMVTADQNLQFQQNLNELPIAVVVLMAQANRIEFLQALVPHLLRTLDALRPREFVRVSA